MRHLIEFYLFRRGKRMSVGSFQIFRICDGAIGKRGEQLLAQSVDFLFNLVFINPIPLLEAMHKKRIL